jgi:ferredoxin hydrogenase large subunit
VDVVNDLVAGKRLIAMIAPSAEGQFGEGITTASWRDALKRVGFSDLVEVALGADMTANAEAAEWAEAYQAGQKKTTSCCPAFVNMIEKHYPMLKDNVSTTVSPMCAVSRKLKAENPDTITVFIGPCVAKKSEVQHQRLEGNADYVLTFGEIRAIIRAKGVTLKPEPNTQQDGSVFGKRFGDSGGVTAAVLEGMQEQGFTEEIKVQKCNGAEECKKALLLLKMGRLPADFVEGMACVGGCVGGPSRHIEPEVTKKNRDKLIGEADDRKIAENLNRHAVMEQVNMHRAKKIGE